MPFIAVAYFVTQENDEFCKSCGGEGKLLCCDGCTNSFHHACLEPPLDPDQEIVGEWYCPSCVARRAEHHIPPTGLLGPVLRKLEDTIPKAFALPGDIRDYFEGVRTGDEGEYEEFGLPRTQNNVGKMNRAGFIEEPNYKETRDSKGNLILCYKCGLTSNGRDIIPCDYCPARWHLDCVNPPLAVPPRRRGDDKPSSSWRCPLHVEHDLAAMGRQEYAAPGELGRVPRLRRPKNALPFDIPYTRGYRNNGIIEVELMEDDFQWDKTKETNMHGKIHRIPERGIRLDFIDRVKKSWYEDHSLPRLAGITQKRIRNSKYRSDGAVLFHPPAETVIKYREPDFWTGTHAMAITETARANAILRNRSIKEQQAVLHLASLSGKGLDGVSGDALAELTNSLISEAPDWVVEAIQKSELDRLLVLRDLITQRLAILGQGGPSSGDRFEAEQEAELDMEMEEEDEEEDVEPEPEPEPESEPEPAPEPEPEPELKQQQQPSPAPPPAAPAAEEHEIARERSGIKLKLTNKNGNYNGREGSRYVVETQLQGLTNGDMEGQGQSEDEDADEEMDYSS